MHGVEDLVLHHVMKHGSVFTQSMYAEARSRRAYELRFAPPRIGFFRLSGVRFTASPFRQ
jgi:hypothetical protein